MVQDTVVTPPMAAVEALSIPASAQGHPTSNVALFLVQPQAAPVIVSTPPALALDPSYLGIVPEPQIIN